MPPTYRATIGRAKSSSALVSGPSPMAAMPPRSEEHTSELQSRRDLVCRLLLEKKKKKKQKQTQEQRITHATCETTALDTHTQDTVPQHNSRRPPTGPPVTYKQIDSERITV